MTRRDAMSRGSLAAITSAAVLAACAVLPPRLVVCPASAVGPRGAEGGPASWRELLVADAEDATPRACDGSPIAAPADACEHGPPPAIPVGRDDGSAIVFGAPFAGQELVWVQVYRGADGDAIGPAALVAGSPDGPEVAALGIVRAPARVTSMRILGGGEADSPRVLVVEGERCGRGRAAACVREARLLRLSGAELVPLRLSGANPGCRESSRVVLEFEGPAAGAPGVVRVRRAFDADARGVYVYEQIEQIEHGRAAGRLGERRYLQLDGVAAGLGSPSLPPARPRS